MVLYFGICDLYGGLSLGLIATLLMGLACVCVVGWYCGLYVYSMSLWFIDFVGCLCSLYCFVIVLFRYRLCLIMVSLCLVCS